MKLNLGCHDDIREGYINIDLYPVSEEVEQADLRTFDLDSGSCEEIMAHSILEHLTFNDGEKALEKWCKWLKPKGTISIITPDIWNVISLGHRGIEHVVGPLYGKPEEPGQAHLSCWWRDKVRKALEDGGCEVVLDKDWLQDMWIIGKKK